MVAVEAKNAQDSGTLPAALRFYTVGSVSIRHMRSVAKNAAPRVKGTVYLSYKGQRPRFDSFTWPPYFAGSFLPY